MARDFVSAIAYLGDSKMLITSSNDKSINFMSLKGEIIKKN